MTDKRDICRFRPTLGGTTDWTYSSVVVGYQNPTDAGVVTNAPYSYRAESYDLTQWEIGQGLYNGTSFLRTTVLYNSSGTGTLQSGAGTKISFTSIPQVALIILAEDVTPAIYPECRLTLTSATAIMTNSVAAATTIYLTPCGGNRIPLVYGTRIVPEVFAEVSQATTDATKSPAACVANSNHDMFFWNDAGTQRLSRSDYWKTAATVTMTIASPCVVTFSGSDFADGIPIVFTNSGGALPTGITAGTTYYVKRTGAVGTPTATFNVAATVGGAAINTSGSQSGTHTGTAGDDFGTVARGSGGNCELQMVNGLLFNKNAITNGPAALKGLFVGTIRTNATATVDWVFGTVSASGGAAVFGVSNVYNQADFVTLIADTTDSWTYSTASTWRAANNSATMRCSVIRALNDTPLQAEYFGSVLAGAATGTRSGVGLDNTAAYSAMATTGSSSDSTNTSAVPSKLSGFIGLGWHWVAPVEWNSTATGSVWVGDGGVPAATQSGFHVHFKA